jgi:hypothetical protein
LLSLLLTRSFLPFFFSLFSWPTFSLQLKELSHPAGGSARHASPLGRARDSQLIEISFEILNCGKASQGQLE